MVRVVGRDIGLISKRDLKLFDQIARDFVRHRFLSSISRLCEFSFFVDFENENRLSPTRGGNTAFSLR